MSVGEYVPGGVVWQIAPSFAASVDAMTGKWYGETDDGFQTPTYGTRREASAALLRDAPCSCSCQCSRRALYGWPTCGACAFDRHDCPCEFAERPGIHTRLGCWTRHDQQLLERE